MSTITVLALEAERPQRIAAPDLNFPATSNNNFLRNAFLILLAFNVFVVSGAISFVLLYLYY